MPRFTYEPELSAAPATGSFAQTIRLLDDSTGAVIATARWSFVSEPKSGVVQVIEVEVIKSKSRGGIGHQMMTAITDQSRKFLATRKAKLRRLWIAVEQKRQVIGRAFLSSCGFHHISTITGVHKDQDILVYLKSTD